jgi:hypothetical protein
MNFSDPTRAPYAPMHARKRGGMLPPATLPVALALLLFSPNGPNFLLALLSVAVLIAGCLLLWRPGEPPILLFTFAYPWLQGSIAIFHANWLGVDAALYSEYTGDMNSAIVMTLTGLLALAVGMRIGAGPRHMGDVYAARGIALSQPIRSWLRLYGLSWALSFAALSFARVMPGLTQPMLALAGMRWVFFFMLGVACFTQGRGLSGLFLAAFLLELAAGIGTYFADFRTVFIITFFAALASRTRFSPRTLLGTGLLFVMVVTLAVVWGAIKSEYRTFVSGGEAAQIVTVDYTTRFAKLYELAAALDAEKLTSGVNQLLRRLTYVEFFSVVLVYVPRSIPHSNGAILWDAVIRPFTPRLLFADKDVIDDTARTNLYTGDLAGSDEGVSISLGYVAEAYIDFGSFGMFAALFGIGLFYGLIYRWLLRWRRSRGLLGVAVATAVLTGVAPLENSLTKVFGSVIVSLIVAVGMIIFIVPRWAPWLARR